MEKMSSFGIRLAKAFGLGLVFGLVAYLISADGAISTLLALFIIYLEYKFR